jgi:hypothetical protein
MHFNTDKIRIKRLANLQRAEGASIRMYSAPSLIAECVHSSVQRLERAPRSQKRDLAPKKERSNNRPIRRRRMTMQRELSKTAHRRVGGLRTPVLFHRRMIV